ncbi:MAG: TOBE domain-containing protein, partial [Cyanobacteria bacterium J06607_6]
TPTTIYDRPATLFVSQFVGTTNLMPGTLVNQDSRGCVVALKDGTEIALATIPDLPLQSSVQVAIRPENLRLSPNPSAGAIAVTVEICLPLGASTIYEVRTASGLKMKVTQPRGVGGAALPTGTPLYLTLTSTEACSVFPIDDSAGL